MKAVGIGETVLDIIFKDGQPQRAVPGGSTFNSIVSLGRTLGAERSDIPIMMVSRTGDDGVADIVTDFLQKNNVSSDAICRKPGTRSTVSLAFLDEDNNARYQFYRDGSENPSDFTPIRFEAGDVLILSSFFAVNPAIREFTRKTIRDAREAGAIIYYDINYRRNHLSDLPAALPNIEENISMADFVRASSEDIALIYGNDDAAQVYKEHISALCTDFICTCGGDPLMVCTANGIFSKEVPEVEPVSTIGAGDSFNAGFLYALIRDGFGRERTGTLTRDEWGMLLDTASQFAASVCGSLENYVPEGFLSSLDKK